MPTPKKGYFLADGTRVPGVTTLLQPLKGDPGALMNWAWKLGKEGKDYREERDHAAGIGTIGHEYIDADIHGREPQKFTAEEFRVDQATFDAMLVKAATSLQAYRSWKAGVKLEIIETEMQMVSEVYRYGGTPDALARLNGELILLDWKTSNHIYPEYIAQISAYAQLWAECRGELPTSAHLLRVGKDEGDFHYHCWPRSVLDTGWRAFRAAQECYELQKQLKKVC